MAYKSFQDMIDTLRAGEAAGMDSVITLKPPSAGVLADILEAHLDHLRADIVDSAPSDSAATRVPPSERP